MLNFVVYKKNHNFVSKFLSSNQDQNKPGIGIEIHKLKWLLLIKWNTNASFSRLILWSTSEHYLKIIVLFFLPR